MTCNYKKRLFVSHANVGSTKILHSIKVWYDIWGKNIIIEKGQLCPILAKLFRMISKIVIQIPKIGDLKGWSFQGNKSNVGLKEN